MSRTVGESVAAAVGFVCFFAAVVVVAGQQQGCNRSTLARATAAVAVVVAVGCIVVAVDFCVAVGGLHSGFSGIWYRRVYCFCWWDPVSPLLSCLLTLVAVDHPGCFGTWCRRVCCFR